MNFFRKRTVVISEFRRKRTVVISLSERSLMAVQFYICFHPGSLVLSFDSFSFGTKVLIQNCIYLCFESGDNLC